MNIIIIGAGNVGFTSAEVFSASHNVLVVENDKIKADSIKNLLNVSVLYEDGTNPRILESVIEEHDAELVVATLPEDGLNLFACMICKRHRPSLRTVATIKNQDFIIDTSAENGFGVDMIISPEAIMSNKIFKLAILENAVDYESIHFLDLAIATFKVSDSHNIVGKAGMNFDIPEKCNIVCIYRGDEVITNIETTVVLPKDRISVIGSEEGIEAFNGMIGVRKANEEFVIMGAEVLGLNIAKALDSMDRKAYVKIIDEDPKLCERASHELSDAVVVNADVIDPNMLKVENVERADVLISVTDSDEKNLLVCMASLKSGTGKIISRYLTKQYGDIFRYTGIETILGYHLTIANEITKGLISDEDAILRMKHDGEYFFSVRVDGNSPLLGKKYGNLSLPQGVRFAAAIRKGDTVFPRYETVFEEEDRILVYTYMAEEGSLKKLFGKTIREL